jgi:hypothetical protein
MTDQAQEVGADAVVGVDLDYETLSCSPARTVDGVLVTSGQSGAQAARKVKIDNSAGQRNRAGIPVVPTPRDT